MGSTSTTVSVRSLAVTRTWAPATATVAAMGPGVANVGMKSSPLVSYLVCWWAVQPTPGRLGARLLNVARDHRYPARAIPAQQARAAAVSPADGVPASGPRSDSMMGVKG